MPPADFEKDDAVKFTHFAGFGGIIHAFAGFEWLMQLTFAAISGGNHQHILIMTRALTFSQKRDTLYSFMEIFKTPNEYRDPITRLLDEVDTHSTLRNNIAHAIWHEGRRPGSIRPMTIITKGGKGKMLGHDDSHKDYTDREIGIIGDRLRAVHNEYIQFLRSSGLMAIIDKQMDDIKAAEAAEGKARAK